MHATWRAASGHYLSSEQCVIHTAEASLNSLQWCAAAWGGVGADGGHFGEAKERLGRGGRPICFNAVTLTKSCQRATLVLPSHDALLLWLYQWQQC